MIYTIKIDDSSPTGKRIINDLRKHTKVVTFEETVLTEDVPDGYLTGEEFFLGIKKELNKRSLENSSFETISPSKAKFLKELKSSVEEVISAKQGKIKLKSADQVINESPRSED